MRIQAAANVPQAPVTMEGAAGCRVRWLVGEGEGAPNFAMREFELDPGGHTPKHFHPYEHEIYVLEGEGAILDGDLERPLRPGDVVYVAPDDVHQFRNTGSGRFRMLCLIPNSAAGQAVTVVPECGLEPRPAGA
ncbi:MAG TPA: cupin domain-containing protein [Lacipirellulaceae bacterium]|nr:cupin domain-containing protein [Lacipirellulaceae bacterium]